MTYSAANHSTITNQLEATKVSTLEPKDSLKAESSKSKSKGKGKKRVTKVAKDMYQIVTDRIIAALENGVKPWACPWDRTQQCDMLPMNFKSKAQYSGVNILLLWSETAIKGYSSPYWLTYKQAAELGGNVIKGQKGTEIIFYKTWEKKNEQGEDEKIPMLRSFVVFNLDQIENIEKPVTVIKEERIKNNEFGVMVHVDDAILATGAVINHVGVRAFYAPSQDSITMPTQDRFTSSSDYYATLLHELTHWTAHKSRLDRKLTGGFGSQDYAFEELIAELGAAFCCADLGVFGEIQHESYIASWLKALDNDKKYIFKAASLASKAHQYLLPR